MKKAIIATAIAASAVIGFSGAASAGGGNSDNAKIHPGHVGYLSSDFTGGGVPAAHFHGGAPYPTGPGGWGGFVSDAAQTGGIPGAHGG